MRRQIPYAVLALVLFACVAFGAPPVVPKDVQVAVGRTTTFEVKVEKGKKLGWQRVFPQEKCTLVRLHSDDPAVYAFLVAPNEKGQFGTAFWTEGDTTGVSLVIDAGEPDIVPPGPGPGPQPPTPDPTKPVPLPGGGLRVLIVMETAQKITPTQHGILYGKVVRDWLAANCVKVGTEPERRIYDKDTDLSGVDPKWSAAMARARTGTPWVIASNGTRYIEQAIPADMPPATFVELLKPLVSK